MSRPQDPQWSSVLPIIVEPQVERNEPALIEHINRSEKEPFHRRRRWGVFEVPTGYSDGLHNFHGKYESLKIGDSLTVRSIRRSHGSKLPVRSGLS
jgi:hypothetical protein